MAFWRKSLMARLVGYFLALSLVTVSLVGYGVYTQAMGDLKRSVVDRLEGVASLKEDALSRWVNDQRRNIVFVAWLPNVQQEASLLLDDSMPLAPQLVAHDKLMTDLTSIITTMSDAQELFILDLNGTIVLSTDSSHQGYAQNEAPYFVQGLSNTYVQAFHASPFSGKPSMAVSTPLFDPNRRRIGVMAAYLSTDRVESIMQARAGLGQTGESYLVDASGTLVSAPVFWKPGDAGGDQVHSAGIDAVLQGQEGAGLYQNYAGVPVVGVYRWLADRDVALLAEMSQAEAFAPATRMIRAILLIGAAAAVALAVGLYLLARQIARPILAIAHTAGQVAAGDLSQSTPVMTDDEVGLLARAFNQMTAQLRVFYQELESRVAERTRELAEANTRLVTEVAERTRAEDRLRQQNEYLAALHEIALALMGRLELHDLFQDLVVRAGQLLDSGHGFVFIAGPDGAEIECKVGVGVFQALIGQPVQRGEGLSGRVWGSGQPLVVDDYDTWPGRLASLPAGSIRAAVGVPLTSGAETVGVLGLAYDWESSRSFGQAEIALLSRFAALASIAVDNAQLFAISQQARAQAEAANVSKSQFLANVSHELRTPLTSILGFTRLVDKRLRERIFPLVPPADPKTERTVQQLEDNLKIVVAEGERLMALINDLLDLEKIEAGKIDWHMEPLPISEVVEQAAAATASLFDEKGLPLVLELAPEPLCVIGDRDRLVQVVINLFSNAVKFTPQGRVMVRSRREPGGDGGNGRPQVVVSVSDTGVGIAAADYERLFQKFTQVSNTLTDKPRGTGLGLAISREIVTHHGGRIWVESQPGAGSTFSFALPLREEAR
jgi:signal transduction histidine kinase